VVYKGLQNGVDEVAVKVAKKAAPSRRELELFISEVSLLSRLHHRNIVQVSKPGSCS
jgi:serine/threonine protein kinase